jgi:hypothetical protein
VVAVTDSNLATGSADDWTGVRPVRFRDEIMAAVSVLVESHKPVQATDIQERLIAVREAHEQKRMKATGRLVGLENPNRDRPLLLTKADQVVRILRATKLAERQEMGNLKATNFAKALVDLDHKDSKAADAVFLGRLFNSPYLTYWRYLVKLHELGEIRIPKKYTPKNKKTSKEYSDFLHSIGLSLDTWSFFILRDFFYDFGLINYVIDDGLRIFPLYEIGAKVGFQYDIPGPSGILHFWPNVQTREFEKDLVREYLSTTGRHWRRIVDLLKLREQCSENSRIPEQLFNVLLMQVAAERINHRVVLSVGMLDPALSSVYGIKSLNLPVNQFGLPYTLIKLEPIGE